MAVRRNDRLIVDWVRQGCRLLDLGCGNGELLELLIDKKQVSGIGVEIDEKLLAECIGRGLQVVNVDIEIGLDIFRNKSFDCAILALTLQEMRDPQNVLREMLRVSSEAIVSIINAGHISKRLTFLFGKAPREEGVEAHEMRRLVTIADFEKLCTDAGLRILDKSYLTTASNKTQSSWRAVEAVYKIGSR